MNYASDLLAEARRRAMLSGLPMSSQEEAGIVNSAAIGAGDRALAKKRLADERLRQLRQQKAAKKAMATQETQKKYDAAGNLLTIDQMTGGKMQGAVTGTIGKGLTMGGDALLKLAGSPYNTGGLVNLASRKLGALTGGVVGTAPLASNAISGTMQSFSPAAIEAARNAGQTMMAQVGAKPVMSTAASLAGSTAGQTAAQAGGQAAGQAAGQGVGQIAGEIAGAVTPVVNIVGAADAARNIWGGDLDRNYDKAGWSQKIARTPLANTGVPGFGATEIEVSKGIGGKNNFVSKFQSKANEEMSRLEEKIVGKPLDKIFRAVGKIFCHVAGTLFKMADGTTKAVEDIKIGDEMLEGGKVFAVGQCELNDLWSYKGARVSPEHAVLENGAWIRVKDSRRGKMIDSEAYEVVYPVCNENHTMIGADGTIWSDFAETDQGTSVNDAERLAFMNNDRETIEYLEEKYGC